MAYIPRRADKLRYSAAEAAIAAALAVIESMAGDPLLTDAVVLLGQAKDKVADFVDRSAVLTVTVTELEMLHSTDEELGRLVRDRLSNA